MVAKEPVPDLGLALGSLAPLASIFVELDPLPDQFFKRQDVERFTNSLTLAPERVSTLLLLLGRVYPLLDLLFPFCGFFEGLCERHVRILAESERSVDGALTQHKILCGLPVLECHHPNVQTRNNPACRVLCNGLNFLLCDRCNDFHVQNLRNALKIKEFSFLLVERKTPIIFQLFITTVDYYLYFYQKTRAVDKRRQGLI